jgi:O-antigen ligase
MILIMGPGLIGMRWMIPALFILAVAGTALGTLGIVFIEPLKDFAAEWFPGLTYTGRTYLWSFAGEQFARRPWTGFGYESFWGPYIKSLELPFDNEWDVRGSVHGHNGYLDLALMMGFPGLIAALIAFVFVPLRDFMRVPMLRENVLLADMFMMLLLFTSLNAFLESFFFRRVDPVWVFFITSVIGLRLVARFPIKTNIGS